MDAPAPPRPPEAPPPRHRRRLHRDREHRILGGVCAGIAETYDLDVTLVRILWVIAGIVWIGIPAYLVAWIALPGEGGEPGMFDDRPRDVGLIAGLALVGVGAFIAVHQLLPHWWHGGELLGALLLIGGGLAILVMRRPVSEHGVDPAPPPETPFQPAPPFEPTPPFESQPQAEPTVETPAVSEASTPASDDTPPVVPPTAWTQSAPWPGPRSRLRDARRTRRASRPRPFLTPLAISLLLIGAGVTSLLQATGAVDVNLTVALAIATVFVGGALVVSSWFGRARALILVGILLVAATSIASALDVPLRGGIGDRSYQPVQLAELQHPYRLAIGHLLIDLRRLPLPARQTTTVEAQLGIGQLEVDVPNSMQVAVDAHAGAGSLMLFGHETGGWDVHDTRATTGDTRGSLQLKLKVGAGQVRVRRFAAGGVELIGGSNP